MLGKLQIIENSTCGRDAILHTLHSKTLQRLGVELLAQLVVVEFGRENPVVEAICVVAIAKRALKSLLAATLIENLFGREV